MVLIKVRLYMTKTKKLAFTADQIKLMMNH